MDKKTTIDDVARIAQVSKTTVSRFLNDKFDNMSETTRARIAQVIQELDYRPNRQARTLRAQHSSIIGIAIADISNFYTTRLLKGIMNGLKSTSYHTIIMDSDLSPEREKTNLERLLDEQIDGLIIQPLAQDSGSYDFLPQNLPVVQIDRYTEPLLWPAFVSDNFVESRDLAHLIQKKGYERVIVVSPPMVNSTRQNRYKGLLNALVDTDVKIEKVITPEMSKLNDIEQEVGTQIVEYLKDDLKTAIYTFNGPLLYDLVKFLRSEHIRIPREVGIAGYDDQAWGDLMEPPVTSIEQNLVQIGYQATQLLVENINTKEGTPEIHCVDSALNIRESL